jgi:hypothetical protein
MQVGRQVDLPRTGEISGVAATGTTAKRAAREAEDSKPVEGMARFGLCGRGLVYLVVGLLALQVAFGHHGRAYRNGALAAIRDKPLGGFLLVALAVAFTGYAGWRLLQAATGHRDEDDERKRAAKRVASLGRGLLYASFAWTDVRFLMTSQESRDRTEPLTARVMSWPGGQTLVCCVGAALIVGGGYMVFRGVTQKFLERLDLHGAPRAAEVAAATVGLVGMVSRGVLVGLVGGFLVQAAVTYDPDKAKGLDASLKSLADEPLGGLLIGVLGIGLVAFGVWSFLEARYRKV